jgi:hypothetical protein
MINGFLIVTTYIYFPSLRIFRCILNVPSLIFIVKPAELTDLCLFKAIMIMNFAGCYLFDKHIFIYFIKPRSPAGYFDSINNIMLGNHGFDNDDHDMRSIFLAYGPGTFLILFFSIFLKNVIIRTVYTTLIQI